LNFALLLEELGSPSYPYQRQQLTPQHGLKMDETNLQESLAVGLNLKICRLNIKGISASKINYLSRLKREYEIVIVAIQETHTTSYLNLLKRGKLCTATFWHRNVR
jgi:hypothetical protein